MPRHIRNILIAVLLALLALAAGINGYIHHQFKTNIDSALKSLQGFAKIKYSDLSTSILSGNVELKNVRISSDFLPETLTLGNITFETPGFVYMLNGPSNLMGGEFPKHLGLALDDFYFDMHGVTADWLDRLVKRMQPVYSSERKLCNGKTIFGPTDYKEMGYTRVLSNMRIAYDFNKDDKTLNINISAGTSNMASMNASINITNISSVSSDKVMQAGMPQLSNVDVTFKDESYAARIVNYCAALGEIEKEEFINAEVKQSDKYFYMIWGFAPGKGLREAYKDFLLKPDLVTLTMTPKSEFNPMLASTMSHKEIVDALNINLKINSLLVEDLSFKMPPKEFSEKFDKRVAKELDFTSLLRGEPIKAPTKVAKKKINKKRQARYHKIQIGDLPRHITDFVRITTTKGNKRQGQLKRLDDNNLYIEKKVSGGKFTMSVPRDKIENVEAYFSK